MTGRSLVIERVRSLRGPNLWFRGPALEAWVRPDGWTSRDVAQVRDRLSTERSGTPGSAGLDDVQATAGAAIVSLLGRLAAGWLSEIQPGASPEVRSGPLPGGTSFRLALACDEEALARAAFDLACDVIAAAPGDRPGFDLPGRLEALQRLAHAVRLGPSTAALAAAARERGIPVRRFGEGSLLLLGQGRHQRRVWAAETDRTGAIAQGIAQDKELTRQLLGAIGVPVPEGSPVGSPEEAWGAAAALGGAVVVKPRDGHQGQGVSTHLSHRAEVEAAFERAAGSGQGVIVERHIDGEDFRLLVVADRVVAAALRRPPEVHGDGVRTVVELVQSLNADPRRGDDHAMPLSRVELDDPHVRDVLREQGLDEESIPPAGHRVRLRRNANLSTGGTAADVTDRVHPDVAARAIEAARVVGLDVAGVDVVCPDIGQPLEAQGGAVVELNAAPGLRMHLYPAEGSPRPVAREIVATLFGSGATGRIPVVGITGVNGKTTTTRLVAAILARAGRTVGMTCTDGIAIAGRWIERGDCSGPQSARRVLLNPAVDAAVLEAARGGILREGLGFDECDVAVVTNIGEGDHLGQDGIDTPEALAEVKRVLVRGVRPDGWAVLNAADPLVAAMAGHHAGRTIYFAREPATDPLEPHRAAGGRAVVVRSGTICLAEGRVEEPFLSLERVPLSHGGRVGFHVENVLAAVATAWALELDRGAVAAALEDFPVGPGGSPGRFNLLSQDGIAVVLDYVHNPSGIQALVSALDQLPYLRRTIVYSAVGDRRDRDIVRQGEALGQGFDRVILYEDTYNRGRPEGQVIGLLQEGLTRGGRVSDIRAGRGGLAAAVLALDLARPGEVVVIQPNDIDEALGHLKNRMGLDLA